MKENSIEETKKQLELILKVRKEQKEIIECLGGSCMNCNQDIKALTESIEILSDYKRALKENEELKRLHIQDNKHLDFIMQYSITVQKVKDKGIRPLIFTEMSFFCSRHLAVTSAQNRMVRTRK